MSIEVGSKVNVFWDMVPPAWNVAVHYIPVATGDSWVFLKEDGSEIRACYFARMDEIKP